MLVRTADQCTFGVPQAVVRECGTLASAAAVSTSDADVVPVPNVSSMNLARLVQFYTKAGELRLADAGSSVRRAWAARFFDRLPRAELFALMEAANYLDAEALLDDSCAYVADMLSGRSPDEIRELLLLPRDQGDEQAREREAEMAWALR